MANSDSTPDDTSSDNASLNSSTHSSTETDIHPGTTSSAIATVSDPPIDQRVAAAQDARESLDPSAFAERRELRLSMRMRRRGLSRGQQRLAAQRLARRAMRQPWYIGARSLVLYLAADGEIDPQVLMRSALADGKRIFLPQLRAGNRLGFAEYHRGARLRRNRFGIPEPLRGRQVTLRELDVVLMPLVAFDRRGNRLGMGGGFYDRTFARLLKPHCSRADVPRLIGLAHGFQQVTGLAQQSWDVPLNGILTDSDWIAVR